MARGVLIDCDPGVDDALALYAALASDAVTVRGVTTVFGNVTVRQATRNVLRLLHVLEPSPAARVGEGSSQPLKDSRLPRRVLQGRDGLGDLGLPLAAASSPLFESTAVITNLIETGAVETLIALGPLTNIAHAFASAPSTMRRLRELVVAAGVIVERGRSIATEFNLAGDLAAARCLLGSGMRIRWVPLNVAAVVAIPAEWPDRFQAAAPRNPVALAIHGLLTAAVRRDAQRLAGSTPRAPAGTPVPETVALVMALEPSLGTWSARRVVIEQGTRSGRLHVEAGQPNAEVCESIRAEAVVDLLWTLWMRLASDGVAHATHS